MGPVPDRVAGPRVIHEVDLGQDLTGQVGVGGIDPGVHDRDGDPARGELPRGLRARPPPGPTAGRRTCQRGHGLRTDLPLGPDRDRPIGLAHRPAGDGGDGTATSTTRLASATTPGWALQTLGEPVGLSLGAS